MKKYDFTPKIEIPQHLRWPVPSELGEDSSLGGNRNFMNIGRPGWDEVEINIAWEEELLDELSDVDDADEIAEILERAEDERYEDPDIYPFDIGVISAAVALAATGCLPFSSCNGGCFEDHHHAEKYPLIAFHVREETLKAIIEAMKEANVGLEPTFNGAVSVYSNDITKLLGFARSILKRRNHFPGNAA